MNKPTENIWVPTVSFLGEQDGTPETELKSRLRPVLFSSKIVDRAYLARVSYGRPDSVNVALCLRSSSEPDSNLLMALGQVFRERFKTEESLDILSLNFEQVMRLSEVCRAFFVRDSACDE